MGCLMDGFKDCPKCKEILPVTEFSKDSNRKDGLYYCCKKCVHDKYHMAYLPKIREKRLLRRQTNKEEVSRKSHGDYLRRKAKKKERIEKEILSKQNNSIKTLVKQSEIFKLCCRCKTIGLLTNFGLLKNSKNGRVGHCKKCAAKGCEKSKKKKPILRRLRGRLLSALKGGYKSGSAVSDLGCSVDGLKGWFSSWFHSGMTHTNSGGKNGWQIDHTIPLTAFDLTDRNQLLLACHYTNLRPMLPKDNSMKSNFVPTFLVQPVPFCGMMVAIALDEDNQVVVKCFK